MSEFLRALGYNPWCYWPFFCAAVILWIISAGWPYRADGTPLQRLNAPFCFGATLLLAMFAGRWPAIWLYRPVNPDECQFLAGALTMVARTEFWWIDGTTSGPLVIAPLTLPGWFGLPIDFVTGRLVGLLLNWGTVLLSYRALRHVHGDRAARLLILPLACFNVLLIFWDFTSYSSEQSPLFLCALAVMLCVTAFQPDGGLGSRGRLAAGGFILGLLPFSKFQVLPLGAGVGLAALIWIWLQPAADRKKIVRDLLSFVGAVVAGFGGMLASLRLSGQWSDFYESYVVHNLHYTQARVAPWASSGHILNYLTDYSWGFSSLHYGLIALLIVSLWGIRAAAWRPLLLGWVLLIAAYGAVLTPGRFYPHYLLFLSFPLSLLVGLQFGSLVNHRTRRTRTLLWSFFLLLGAGIQVADRFSDRNPLLALVPVPSVRANAVNFINHVKQPGDSLAVWGWRSELYVETQLPQATREAHTEAQVSDHPQRDYYRARFLADMRANQPAFFIDVVGPEDFNLHDLPRQGHENFPDLKDYIEREYTLVSKNQPVRVYVRRTLMHN